MAAIENLEIIVEVDISSALAALSDLKQELREVSAAISQVDARGAEGIDIDTDVHDVERELAMARAKIEAFEQGTSVDIPMHVHDRGFEEILGRAGASSVPELTGRWQDDMLAAFADAAPMDFGGFNRPRGRGIDDRSRIMRRLTRMSGKIREAVGEMTDFNLRMSDMHNALASVVPLLIVFIGVIPTAVAAIAALATAAITAAGALVAIGGLGLLGAAGGGRRPSMEDLQNELSEVVDDAWEAFAPLANRLSSVFDSAMDGLERFFNAIVAEDDALMTLVDDLEAFGGWFTEFFPKMLRGMSATLEALAPVFGGMAEFLNQSTMMRDLTRITLEAADALGTLTIQLGRMLLTLAEMGVGFTVVTTKILAFVGLINDVFIALGWTNEQLGMVIGSLLTLASAIALANTRLFAFALQAAKSAIVALYSFWVGLINANSAMTYLSATAIGNAIKSLGSFVIAVLTGSTSLYTLATSALTATGAVAALMTVITLGAAVALAGIAMSIASNFFTMADGIDSATSSMKDFNRVAGKTSGTGFNPYGGDRPAGAGDGRGTGTSGSGRSGGTTINYESTGDDTKDKSNLDKTVWRANRTT